MADEQGNEQEQEKKFTQADLDAIIQKRLARAEEKQKEAIQAASTLAEQETLAAEKKWQELAGVHEARVKTLEPLEAQVKVYQEMVGGMLKDRVKALGDAAKTAVAGLPKSMSALEKLNWLSKNEGLFEAGTSRIGTPAKRKAQRKDKSPADMGHRQLRI